MAGRTSGQKLKRPSAQGKWVRGALEMRNSGTLYYILHEQELKISKRTLKVAEEAKQAGTEGGIDNRDGGNVCMSPCEASPSVRGAKRVKYAQVQLQAHNANDSGQRWPVEIV